MIDKPFTAEQLKVLAGTFAEWSGRREPLPRAEFLRMQDAEIDGIFDLAPGEDGLQATFRALAIATYDKLAEIGILAHPFRVDAHEAAGTVIRLQAVQDLASPDLISQWQAWPDAFNGLLERHPRLALREAMGWIGETDSFQSWPYGREPAISDWIDLGRLPPPPFDDRLEIVTPRFFERLRTARAGAGGFWVHADGLRFLAEPEWRREKVDSRRTSEGARRRQAASERMIASASPSSERVVASARNDAAFWAWLREWELSLERLPIPPAGTEFGGPIRIGEQTATPPGLPSLTSMGLPDEFDAFLSRAIPARERSAPGFDLMAVFALREAIRRELGLTESPRRLLGSPK